MKHLLCWTLLLASPYAFAQSTSTSADTVSETDTKKKSPRVKYKERTEIDFEGVEVEGAITAPAMSRIEQIKALEFDLMVNIRRSFKKEIVATVNDIK